jgi:PAS domain S-box-containing protein
MQDSIGLASPAPASAATAGMSAPEPLKLTLDLCRSLYDAWPDAVCAFVDQKLLFVNRRGLGLLGGSAEQLLGCAVARFIAPDRLPLSPLELQRMTAARSELPRMVQTLRRLDLTEAEVEITLRPMLLAGQWGLLLVMRDVSDRTRVVETLQKSREELRRLDQERETGTRVALAGRALLQRLAGGADVPEFFDLACRAIEEALPGAVAIVARLSSRGLNTRLVAGPQWQKATGRALSEAQFEARSCPWGVCALEGEASYLPDLSSLAVTPAIDALRAAGLTVCWSLPIVFPGARRFGALSVLFASPRQPSETEKEFLGNVVQLVSIAIERARFRAADSARAQPAPVDAVAAFGEGGKLLTANAAALALMGLEEGAIGKSSRELFLQVITETGATIASAQWPWTLALSAGRPLTRAVIGLRRRDHAIVWLSCSALPLPPGGHFDRAIALVRLEAIGDLPDPVESPAKVADMSAHLSETLRLQRAIDDREFFLEYQPRASVATGEIVGVEALLRWRAPDGRIRQPLDFLPVAEQSGLILPLSEWVLRTALAQAAQWRKAGLPPLTLSVNISPRAFCDLAFPGQVQRALEDSGFDAGWLDLDVTERCLMLESDQLVPILAELKSIGVGLAVDDFGTGFSSMSNLQQFPLSRLKLDRSLTRRVPDDADAAAIVRGVIALARELHLKVIAEGVERQGQLDFMRASGCDEFEGYLLGRAVPASEFERRLTASRRASA